MQVAKNTAFKLKWDIPYTKTAPVETTLRLVIESPSGIKYYSSTDTTALGQFTIVAPNATAKTPGSITTKDITLDAKGVHRISIEALGTTTTDVSNYTKIAKKSLIVIDTPSASATLSAGVTI